MQTTGDRTAFPAGTAVSGIGTADSSDINDPFTECDALMRERDALVYHRQMLERKKTELEQSLQKQRSDNEVHPALFVFHSAEALLMATPSDRVRRPFSNYGITNHCVHNSPVLSPWSTPIGSGVGATGMTGYQKSFHAHYLTRTLLQTETIFLCSPHRNPVIDALSTVHPALILRELELDVPEISEAMVQYVYQLQTAGRLEYLGIHLRRVTPTMKLLCNLQSLRSIDLSSTAITKEDLRDLQECHNLVKLDLSYCRGVTDLSHISLIKTLEVFKLTRCNTIIGVGALGRLPRLKELYLSETLVTDEDVRLLSESNTLVTIVLKSCRSLTNVNPLSSIATLEVINISYCGSLIHVVELSKLPALREINLSFTRITDDDVRLLSESNTLVKIDLSWCKALTNVNPLSSITTLEVIKLSYTRSLIHVGALGKFPVLKEVELSNTHITDDNVHLLSESNTLVKIDLSWCKALTNVAPLSSIATLEVIYLSECTSLTHVGALGRLPVLKEVNLSNTHITDDDVRLVSESNTLVKIDLSWCRALTNVAPLSSIASLEVLKLSGCTSLTHVGALGKFPVLKEVDLSNTHITDDNVRLLSESHTLVKICLNCCTKLTNVDPLFSIATLEIINLSGCTSLTHVGALGKLPALRELNLRNTRVADEEVNSLKSLRRELGLSSICI